ncbi:hypothetical protein GGR58DRAFT_468843 [Xylaria digitata]|nr:hypothetical protein GGR58DRAFT_468843 [Xylaria digitata]
MGNGSRQSHPKSRNGCGQCKRRRVRCNGQGPVCSNCHRRNELCDYLQDYNSQPSGIEASQNHGHITLSALSHTSHPTKGTGFVDVHTCLSFWSDLFLALDYYPVFANEKELLAYTTAFLKTDWAPSTLSQDELPILEGDYDYQKKRLGYLLPTISSLCAIHQTMQQESQSPDTHAKAIQHNITASARFRHVEHGIHEGNWLPMLMFGVGYIMFNFAAAQSAPDYSFEYLNIFHVLRGAARLGDEVGVFLEKSELSGVLERRRPEITQPSEPDNSLQAMNELSQAEHPEGTLEATRTHCQHALESLKWWTRFVRGVPRNWKQFILWPASVTDGFVMALVEKQPVALLIYIYWCVVMHRAPRRWYTDGWHQRIAVAAMSELGPEYSALLKWPCLALSPPLIEDISLPASTHSSLAFFQRM